jgi:hypothetical protein
MKEPALQAACTAFVSKAARKAKDAALDIDQLREASLEGAETVACFAKPITCICSSKKTEKRGDI